jgi:hypothetical protein
MEVGKHEEQQQRNNAGNDYNANGNAIHKWRRSVLLWSALLRLDRRFWENRWINVFTES